MRRDAPQATLGQQLNLPPACSAAAAFGPLAGAPAIPRLPPNQPGAAAAGGGGYAGRYPGAAAGGVAGGAPFARAGSGSAGGGGYGGGTLAAGYPGVGGPPSAFGGPMGGPIGGGPPGPPRGGGAAAANGAAASEVAALRAQVEQMQRSLSEQVVQSDVLRTRVKGLEAELGTAKAAASVAGKASAAAAEHQARLLHCFVIEFFCRSCYSCRQRGRQGVRGCSGAPGAPAAL